MLLLLLLLLLCHCYLSHQVFLVISASGHASASLVLILIFTSSARSLAVVLLANLPLVLRLSHGPRNAHVAVVIIRVCKEAGVVFIYLLTL